MRPRCKHRVATLDCIRSTWVQASRMRWKVIDQNSLYSPRLQPSVNNRTKGRTCSTVSSLALCTRSVKRRLRIIRSLKENLSNNLSDTRSLHFKKLSISIHLLYLIRIVAIQFSSKLFLHFFETFPVFLSGKEKGYTFTFVFTKARDTCWDGRDADSALQRMQRNATAAASSHRSSAC